MRKIIKGATPSEEEFIFKGKLLWEFLNKNKEVNIRIFSFWFILLSSLALLAIFSSKKVDKIDLGSTITIVALGIIFYIYSFYYNKRKYFKHIKHLAQKYSELDYYEINFSSQRVSYKDDIIQFSYPWENVKTFTIYKNNIFLLFGGVDIIHSIIMNQDTIGDQDLNEIVSYIEEKSKIPLPNLKHTK